MVNLNLLFNHRNQTPQTYYNEKTNFITDSGFFHGCVGAS